MIFALQKIGNQLPPAAKSQPFGTASRPRLAVRALLEQPQFTSLVDNDDLSNLDDNGYVEQSTFKTENVAHLDVQPHNLVI